MLTIPFSQVFINDPFWSPRLDKNAAAALDHQWDQLERSGCFHNFRILSGEEGFREGWFFADSDAYKWLDAAARVYINYPGKTLKTKMDTFIEWIGKAQAEDGYIYTYNQIHFPDQRWKNLQIEHELYCIGHLIEAAVSHFQSTKEETLLKIGIKAADLLLKTFLGAGSWATPGHQEIEIALIRLAEVTSSPEYLDLAEQFLERRGRQSLFGFSLLFENQRVEKRKKHVDLNRETYYKNHPEQAGKYTVPPPNQINKPASAESRWMISAFTGQYFQQHKPIWQQTTPVGHAVRFAYQQTAAARLVKHRHNPEIIPILEKVWQRMVFRRMSISGGIGALPLSEGFGRDYEMDPEITYNETCAALGCMFWNWEMTQLTGEAAYADLFEWQLYNAAMVGIGPDGRSYYYNNPLIHKEAVNRQPWFEIPCCPSNISRTWANLGEYLYSAGKDQLWVHQYVGSHVSLGFETLVRLEVESALPFEGNITIRVTPEEAETFTLNLRIPSWAGDVLININDTIYPTALSKKQASQTASGYNPYISQYLPIHRSWEPGDTIFIQFEMPIRFQSSHPRVKETHNKVAVSRGPFLYCLEKSDNPNVDIFFTDVKRDSLTYIGLPDNNATIPVIKGKNTAGDPLVLIPYPFIGYRSSAPMTVFLLSEG